jgi:DNA repair protein RecO (recombination protein O)
MALVRDSAVCVRKFAFSETSQILSLLTREHGLQRVLAKGAHRRTKAGASKFDGGIDLLDGGVAVFNHAPQKDLPPLTEWTLIDGRPGLRKSLRAMHLALYAAEMCELLLGEHDPHPAVFDRMAWLLDELASGRREQAFVAFELDLLREVGLLPELARCMHCGRPAAAGRGREAYFSSRRGGVVCRQCADGTPDRRAIDAVLLRLANSIVGLLPKGAPPQRLPELTRRQTDPLNAMLADFLQHTLSRPLKLRAYVMG